ncbi:hypothetical protein [uncultured Paenibacillus sp.]|uniref:hypothetical protein n=1 Tax=uncultured Paenibacillus sp. TaxID=227322 RepID=UPI0015A9FB0C|nr:hypothetical protein [uncultured Paenibacillus sp.]DAW22598.1 MAG TPA: hypothetical protein [Caudoviricetes sp.]
MRFMRSNKPEPINKNTVTFGAGGDDPRTVKVRKIVVGQWLELFGAVQSLPQLIIGALGARPEERAAYVVVAIEQSLEEVVRVVSILTGLDTEYLIKNAAADEVFEFFMETAKVNNFGDLLKNVQSVLSLAAPAAADQNAN